MSPQVLLSRLAILSIQNFLQLTDSLIVGSTLCWVCSRGASLTTSTRRILARRCLLINDWVLFSSGSGPSGNRKERVKNHRAEKQFDPESFESREAEWTK
ncbi:hypothetical protein J3R83DRAFT_2241 [Lanmaoa asiatica]|nr:hypothetical protein J3R83DRAFT_2241 [Lanmaoa asiatica]